MCLLLRALAFWYLACLSCQGGAGQKGPGNVCEEIFVLPTNCNSAFLCRVHGDLMPSDLLQVVQGPMNGEPVDRCNIEVLTDRRHGVRKVLCALVESARNPRVAAKAVAYLLQSTVCFCLEAFLVKVLRCNCKSTSNTSDGWERNQSRRTTAGWWLQLARCELGRCRWQQRWSLLHRLARRLQGS